MSAVETVEHSSFERYGNALRTRWPAFVGPLIVCVIIGALVVVTTPDTWSAKTEVYIGAEGAENTDQALQRVQLTTAMLDSLLDLLDSPVGAGSISRHMGGALTPEQVEHRLDPRRVGGTIVVSVDAIGDSAAGAAKLSAEGALELGRLTRRYGTTPDAPLREVVVVTPRGSVQRVDHTARTMLIALGLGVVSGVAVTILLPALRRRRPATDTTALV